MNDWVNDYRWQERYLPAVARLIGPYTLRVATRSEDRHNATDMVVLTDGVSDIAVRLRRHAVLHVLNSRHEFTVRSWRRSGVTTELDKLADGKAHRMFYGFVAPHPYLDVCHWTYIDVDHVRDFLSDRGNAIAAHTNADGGSGFLVYRLADLPPGGIVGRGDWSDYAPPSAPARQRALL